MATPLFAIMLIASQPAQSSADPHLQSNPVYRQALQVGFPMSTGSPVKLPPPLILDGADGQTLRARLAALPDRTVPVDELLRKSVVAPVVFGFRDVVAADTDAPVRGLDVYFVAYGRLEPAQGEKLLRETLAAVQKEAKIHQLSAADLARRKIELPPPGDKLSGYRYWFAEFALLDKVQLSATAQTFVSHTERSVVAASVIDARFANDEQFPNRWRPLKIDPVTGKAEPGEPQVYDGCASYLRVTRLGEPAGALFVEYHIVFVEPKAWFGGANLLRSKLPVLIQSQVRSFRRQMSAVQ